MNEIPARIRGSFIETREHLRFAEFCDACRDFRYIGLCHGPPGVGKTLSAHRYMEVEGLEASEASTPVPETQQEVIETQTTILFTVPVINSPKIVISGIGDQRQRLLQTLLEPVVRAQEAIYRQESDRRLERREMLRRHDWSTGPPPPPTPLPMEEVLQECQVRRRMISDPTRLVLIDEADRLRMAGLEAARAVYDEGGIGLVLIGMPGMEKRLARYPQFYSRIGFIHGFRVLTPTDVRRLLTGGWTPPGVNLPPFTEEAVAAVIRITGGNLRLLDRLLSQAGRIARINSLETLSVEAVNAARENLVIGQA